MAGKIHFILTGGTIDSYYEGTKDTAIPNRHSVIPAYLASLKLYEQFEFTEVCMKDSRSLTQSDRAKMLRAIEKSPCKRIIVTHGTYTMPETARFLEASGGKNGKVIILVGSMIPLAGFPNSDAAFNLGFAISKSQDLPNGIYVCMNGKVFSPAEVEKALDRGRFYSAGGRK